MVTSAARRLFVAGALAVALVIAAQAALAAPPPKVGAAFDSGPYGADTLMTETYKTMAVMSVPAGIYQVSGQITADLYTTGLASVECELLYGATVFAHGSAIGSFLVGPFTAFTMIGTTGPSGTGGSSLSIRCKGSGMLTVSGSKVSARMVAVSVASVTFLSN